MNWFGWLLVAWWATSALLTVTYVGKQRKPLEPGVAAIAVLIYAALTVGLLTVGTK